MAIFEITYTDHRASVLKDWLDDINSIAHSYRNNIPQFLSLQGEDKITNRNRILNSYSPSQRAKYENQSPEKWPLKIGIRLCIEQDRANRAGLLTEGIEIVSSNVPAFKVAALAQLEADPQYRPVSKLIPTISANGTLQKRSPNFTVWVWCRALSSVKNNYSGQIFNITPFVDSVETYVDKNGGNFQLSVAPLLCEIIDDTWQIKKTTLSLTANKQEYLAKSHVTTNEMQQAKFLFHNIISANDVVWIRYEALEIEGAQRIEDSLAFNVGPENLPNRIYDMIGLFDSNSQSISINGQSVDVNIQLSGRDLAKVFIDDGTYFYYSELMQGQFGNMGSSSNKTGLTKRLLADGSQFYLSLFFNNTIDRIFKFVIQQLSTIEIVPSSLFVNYGDKRNTRLIEGKQENFLQWQEQRNKLVEDIFKQIEFIRSTNRLTATTRTEEKAIISNLYRELIAFFKALRINKVRRVAGTAQSKTIGWQAFVYKNEPILEDAYPQLFARQLFDITATRVVVIEDSELVIRVDQLLDLDEGQQVNANSKELRKEPAAGIWQIIKLVIDDAVLKRTVIDSSLSSANGSLLNFFRKVCQEPFVELLMDTYGDTYNLLIRRPPTDKVGILSMLNARVKTETGDIKSGIIDIEADDVIREQLTRASNEAYSWYHLVPQANFYGNASSYTLAYLPAIYFPEYAAIWGNKPLQISHNYLPSFGKENTEAVDKVFRQAAEDLRYMIESHAYLPFTRFGTLVINRDRRHKVGNIIRYKPTGEIFFIESVRHIHKIGEKTIDEQTVLQVSRGMVEQLIYGIPRVQGQETISESISYFDIINTTIDYQYKENTTFEEKRVKKGTRIIKKGEVIGTPLSLSLPKAIVTPQINTNLHFLDELPNANRDIFNQLINGANALGYAVIITNGKRNYQEQVALHRANPKNAKPGNSKHESGSAIDINLVNIVTRKQLFKSSSKQDWLQTGVPQLAANLSIKWGGNSFRNYYDPVHFEIALIVAEDEVEDIYETQLIRKGGKTLDISKLFGKVRVNKDVFDFFLKGLQFDPKYQTVTTTSTNSGEEVIIFGNR